MRTELPPNNFTQVNEQNEELTKQKNISLTQKCLLAALLSYQSAIGKGTASDISWVPGYLTHTVNKARRLKIHRHFSMTPARRDHQTSGLEGNTK